MASAVAEPDTPGWQVGKSLADCLKHMLDQEVACDVTFSIQVPDKPQGTVSAHKFMLRARSPVFESMFVGAYSERSEIVICDIELEPFREMLRYIYTDEVELTGDNVLHILSAAKRYSLDGLADKCNAYLSTMLTQENVCPILSQSVFYQEEDLVKKCLDLIAPKIKTISKTEAFYEMSHDALFKVVQYDLLAEDAEVELFEGCLEWGRRRAKGDTQQEIDADIRRLLGDCLYQIRFLYMDASAFAETFGQTGVLSADEKTDIFCSILTKSPSHRDSFGRRGFNLLPRVPLTHTKRCSTSYSSSPCHTGYATIEEKFTLSTKQRSTVFGFSVYGGAANTDHDLCITIFNTATKTEEIKHEGKVHTVQQGQAIPVRLNRAVIFEPNTEYEVTVTNTGDTFFGYDAKILETVGMFTQTQLLGPNGNFHCTLVPEITFQVC